MISKIYGYTLTYCKNQNQNKSQRSFGYGRYIGNCLNAPLQPKLEQKALSAITKVMPKNAKPINSKKFIDIIQNPYAAFKTSDGNTLVALKAPTENLADQTLFLISPKGDGVAINYDGDGGANDFAFQMANNSVKVLLAKTKR